MDTVPEEKGDKRGKRNKGEEKSGGRRKENGQCLQVDEHDQLPSTKTVEFVQYHILIYIKKKKSRKTLSYHSVSSVFLFIHTRGIESVCKCVCV